MFLFRDRAEELVTAFEFNIKPSYSLLNLNHTFVINKVFSSASLSLSDKVAVTEPLPWEPEPGQALEHATVPVVLFNYLPNKQAVSQSQSKMTASSEKSSCVMLLEAVGN